MLVLSSTHSLTLCGKGANTHSLRTDPNNRPVRIQNHFEKNRNGGIFETFPDAETGRPVEAPPGGLIILYHLLNHQEKINLPHNLQVLEQVLSFQRCSLQGLK